MSTEKTLDSKSALETYINCFNSSDFDTLRTVLAPNFRRVAPDWCAQNPDEMIQGMRKVHEAYQGFRLTIDEALFDPKLALTRWTAVGNYTGPDGKSTPVQVSGASMMRFDGGLMTEEWVYYDSAALTSALNVSTIPHAAS